MKKPYLTLVPAILAIQGFLAMLAPNSFIQGGAAMADAAQLHAVRSFGGLYLGMAAFLVAARFTPAMRDSGVLAAVLAIAGLLAGRTVSFIADGLAAPGLFASALVELALLAWGGVILRRGIRRDKPQG
jgi:hypothetical protein